MWLVECGFRPMTALVKFSDFRTSDSSDGQQLLSWLLFFLSKVLLPIEFIYLALEQSKRAQKFDKFSYINFHPCVSYTIISQRSGVSVQSLTAF